MKTASSHSARNADAAAIIEASVTNRVVFKDVKSSLAFLKASLVAVSGVFTVSRVASTSSRMSRARGSTSWQARTTELVHTTTASHARRMSAVLAITAARARTTNARRATATPPATSDAPTTAVGGTSIVRPAAVDACRRVCSGRDEQETSDRQPGAALRRGLHGLFARHSGRGGRAAGCWQAVRMLCIKRRGEEGSTVLGRSPGSSMHFEGVRRGMWRKDVNKLHEAARAIHILRVHSARCRGRPACI